MDFDDAVTYLRSRLRLGIKFGNERFVALLERLGNPHKSLRVVHIAGTKGKGSTATMVGSVLQAAGYRTGVYLSPYVYDVRERIQIDRVMIPREDFARWVTAIKPHVEALEETDFGPTTEFELKTAVGFCYFAEQKVDYAVIEVGLGGRLDATNVFDSPLVTAITSIGLDHVELLGETLTEIAREKAGIVKPGVPCVTAVPDGSEAFATIAEICAERRAPLLSVSEVRPGASPPDSGIWFEGTADGDLTIRTPLRRLDGLRLRLHGSFQHANAAVALAAVDAIPASDPLQGPPPAKGRESVRPAITDEQARAGLEKAYLPGRFEQIHDRPLVFVDVAHNEMSGQALATALREAIGSGPSEEDRADMNPRRLILVVGLSRTHEPGPFLEPLLALRPAAVIATQPEFRPRDAGESAAVAADAKVDHVRVVTTSVVDACREALALASPSDVVCLTGSLYTVGDVPPAVWRQLLEERKFA